MKQLIHWSIKERQQWQIPNISEVSYRVSGCIYGHETIKDGESFRSGSDIQGIVVTNEEVIIRTENSVYCCKLKKCILGSYGQRTGVAVWFTITRIKRRAYYICGTFSKISDSKNVMQGQFKWNFNVDIGCSKAEKSTAPNGYMR